MQDHRYAFEVEGTPQEIWPMFWHRRRLVEHGDVRIEILHPGDSDGNGLIRHCQFRVPWWCLSGGRAQSFEWLTEVEPYQSWRYDGVGKPIWSKARGWTRLEDLGDGRTRVHFRETYHIFNPLLRLLFEKAMHRFISKDNDRIIKESIDQFVRLSRARASGRS